MTNEQLATLLEGMRQEISNLSEKVGASITEGERLGVRVYKKSGEVVSILSVDNFMGSDDTEVRPIGELVAVELLRAYVATLEKRIKMLKPAN